MLISTTVRNSMADSIDDDIGAGGRFRLYNQDPDTATGLVKVATCSLSTPAFGNAATGVITLDVTPAVQDASPNAGTVTYAGLYASAGAADSAWLCKLGVATGGTPDLTMANNTVATTDTVQITSFTITQPPGSVDSS